MGKRRDPGHYRRLYYFICCFAENHGGRLPTHRDLIAYGWFSSTASADYAFRSMVRSGWLVANSRNGRTYYTIAGARYVLPKKWLDISEGK